MDGVCAAPRAPRPSLGRRRGAPRRALRRAGGQVAPAAVGPRAPSDAGVPPAPPRARRGAREPVRERGGGGGGAHRRDARGARRRRNRRRRRRRFTRATRRDARRVRDARAGGCCAAGGSERGVCRAAVRGRGEETRRGDDAVGRGNRGRRAADALLDGAKRSASFGGRERLFCVRERVRDFRMRLPFLARESAPSRVRGFRYLTRREKAQPRRWRF